MTTNAALRDTLQELHRQTAQSPLFNPVFQLSLDLSREIENGALSLGDVGGLVAELECESLQVRARHLARMLAPVGIADNLAAFDRLATSDKCDFDAFNCRWQSPLMHVVFTAHPTFLLNRAQSDAVAQAASDGDVSEQLGCIAPADRDHVTLDYEHEEAMAAITRAAAARDRLVDRLFAQAQKQWPDQWRSLRPAPFRFASWVGYDMDGRTDIGWSTCIRFRLREKAMRLELYASALRSISAAAEVAAKLDAAAAYAREMEAVFVQPHDSPDQLSAMANRLTDDHPDKLVSLDSVIASLEALANDQDDADTARAILVAASAMRSDGLGQGWVHFRVNASQLQNAIRRRIDPGQTLDLSSHTALARLRTLLVEEKPLRSNFAALAIEDTTAVRQFLIMAQILKHVDTDAPIRMLIAECEDPQTVLAALYFAKLFGIDEKVDVSPLFETESAMEHGARFLDALFAEPAYRDYARQRGRVAVQTGFSDAGRFVGQLPAALAIERLQGRLAKMMAKHGLTDVAALIFNTHGESMGRGAHPSSMTDRLTYPLSLWTRSRFADARIALEPEVSFQGGDGYLWFRTPELALATLVRIAEVECAALPASKDPFYQQTDVSLDFYRGIRRVQRDFLESRTYARSLTAFGLGLLNETGSRKARRQFDVAADRAMSLRQIRAIPHNAIMQQLGYPVNLIAGTGTAADEDVEAVADLISKSLRGRQIMRMLRASNRLASIKSVAAYGELFNSAYWASRPYRGTESVLEPACLALAERLTTDDRNSAFRTLTSRLRVDALKLHRLLALVPDDSSQDGREDVRRSLGILQALRLALMQHIFLRAVQVPAFSRSNDISRDDVLEMIFALRIDDALAQFRRAFPVSSPSIATFDVNEPTDYPDRSEQAYAHIHAQFIEPIERSYQLILRVGGAIANHFGAHG
ncbi:MAG: phosphoenolpyruvate carboxylase [Sphingomonadales bacterium]|nr:phosphoenolpyruvate carboxylase [Sphingomonadales bacterium]